MTDEDKKLLLTDLCGRLPYGLKVKVTDVDGFTFEGELRIISKGWCKLHISDPKKKARVKNKVIPLNYIKPYLRPMSSMTKEEEAIYTNYQIVVKGLGIVFEYNLDFVTEWLNSHHLDWRHLIQKGLALEAPEGMYKLKQ